MKRIGLVPASMIGALRKSTRYRRMPHVPFDAPVLSLIRQKSTTAVSPDSKLLDHLSESLSEDLGGSLSDDRILKGSLAERRNNIFDVPSKRHDNALL